MPDKIKYVYLLEDFLIICSVLKIKILIYFPKINNYFIYIFFSIQKKKTKKLTK
jgi:hypothetical protein